MSCFPCLCSSGLSGETDARGYMQRPVSRKRRLILGKSSHGHMTGRPQDVPSESRGAGRL